MSDVVNLSAEFVEDAEQMVSLSQQDTLLVNRVMSLPYKILQNYYKDGLSLLVLHELAHEECFDLKRAVYLVDNPDFDYMIGVAGFSRDECEYHEEEPWSAIDTFNATMKRSLFHKEIKSIQKSSLKRQYHELDESPEISNLAKLLGFEKPEYTTWELPEGNYGIFLFERDGDLSHWRKLMLRNIVALLGFSGRI
jgi:hypothetical protein